MYKINYYWIVPIGILEHIYSMTRHYDEWDMRIIQKQYDDVRHLFSMDLIKAK